MKAHVIFIITQVSQVILLTTDVSDEHWFFIKKNND